MTGVGFSKVRFDALSNFSENHFWFAGRQALVARILDAELTDKRMLALDLGCGPGMWLPSWLRYAHTVIGIDPFADGVDQGQFEEGIELVEGTISALPVLDGQADLVIVLDVLEHVDDRTALAEIKRALCTGGHVVATVPAMPWLWSYRDDDAGHLRRYTRASLLELFQDAGLQVHKMQYYQSLLFPLVAVSRLLGRRSAKARDREDMPPKRLNAFLRGVNMLEVNSGLRLPFGSSLVLLAKKVD